MSESEDKFELLIRQIALAWPRGDSRVDYLREAINELISLAKSEQIEADARVCDSTELLWDVRVWNDMSKVGVSRRTAYDLAALIRAQKEPVQESGE